MINFFRTIRQNMIKENKTTKYLLYALGEIVLVVVGILIALWINNKSERNKELANEQTLIQKLHEENQINLVSMGNDIEYRKELPEVLEHFSVFLNNQSIEDKKENLQDYLRKTLRTSTFSYPRINLTNYINLSNKYYSDLTKELTYLNELHESLELMSEKGAEIKLKNFINPLKTEVDFLNLKITSYETFKSLEFRNNIALVLSVEEEITRKFNQTLKQSKKIDSMINIHSIN
jgi:hypothetical protein